LQEWADDWGQMEKDHRHFSHMYGLYPGNVISINRNPELKTACVNVLEQRGDGGTGFSRGWKMALWARLYDGNRANKIYKQYLQEQSFPQLFSKCFNPLQIDGTLGVTAGITEMLVQSHESVIDLLPAIPDEWQSGSFQGVCVRGGFELNFNWKEGKVNQVEILSKTGNKCRIKAGISVNVSSKGKKVKVKKLKDDSVEFETEPGVLYTLVTS
jgi:alpha-L-fucosidase 2